MTLSIKVLRPILFNTFPPIGRMNLTYTPCELAPTLSIKQPLFLRVLGLHIQTVHTPQLIKFGNKEIYCCSIDINLHARNPEAGDNYQSRMICMLSQPLQLQPPTKPAGRMIKTDMRNWHFSTEWEIVWMC